jgi:hypothetical protein
MTATPMSQNAAVKLVSSSIVAGKRCCLTAMLLLALSGASCQKSAPVSSLEQAQRFVVALNDKNVDAMFALAATPFRYHNQEWQSARDGRGFTLGASTDRVLTDAYTLQSLFRQLVGTVRIEQSTAAQNPPPKPDLLRQYLKGFELQWAALDVFVFLRGFGDVEHIAIVGVDPASNTVTAMYLN